ncbi:uncharacterized protein LOC135179812 [Pogoniulus pusillus]|uniref:uncharacterized protein LOC135179812 n=1 Tax=Pogoniulus pusillus TaxID=488313 RepID=UPI0030B92016
MAVLMLLLLLLLLLGLLWVMLPAKQRRTSSRRRRPMRERRVPMREHRAPLRLPGPGQPAAAPQAPAALRSAQPLLGSRPRGAAGPPVAASIFGALPPVAALRPGAACAGSARGYRQQPHTALRGSPGGASPLYVENGDRDRQRRPRLPVPFGRKKDSGAQPGSGTAAARLAARAMFADWPPGAAWPPVAASIFRALPPVPEAAARPGTACAGSAWGYRRQPPAALQGSQGRTCPLCGCGYGYREWHRQRRPRTPVPVRAFRDTGRVRTSVMQEQRAPAWQPGSGMAAALPQGAAWPPRAVSTLPRLPPHRGAIPVGSLWGSVTMVPLQPPAPELESQALVPASPAACTTPLHSTASCVWVEEVVRAVVVLPVEHPSGFNTASVCQAPEKVVWDTAVVVLPVEHHIKCSTATVCQAPEVAWDSDVVVMPAEHPIECTTATACQAPEVAWDSDVVVMPAEHPIECTTATACQAPEEGAWDSDVVVMPAEHPGGASRRVQHSHCVPGTRGGRSGFCIALCQLPGNTGA